ncbi:hypothetical protein [Vibrio diazotrophicus]|uniref:hypothetical protein n=1 Tax=Vibrio diazotrophicus TaxID=685 RepID=UPI0005AAEE07|nr:hypothetical protein [Vibrio diazotrophicus]
MFKTGYKICSRLRADEKCFRIERYDSGLFIEIFHEHVPAIRLNQESQIQALISLVLNNVEVHNETLLHSYLNKRSNKPVAARLHQINIEYPERGVKRTYCSCSGINAWVDEVISKSSFRLGD